ncbi:MAG: nitronate monooxygenase [Ignavibacteria bacterium]|nr:nitronate monooxygenase [Ignavibacteria bacterium]
MNHNKLPLIIQGGMGVNISSPLLASTVSRLNQQGTISGTALEWVMVRSLQMGDPGENFRRALASFPFQETVKEIFNKFYLPGGKAKSAPFKGISHINLKPSGLLIALIICANFAMVTLAKEGHDKPVSINYLEKIAMPHVYALTGAIMAGVDIITMGAGIPLQIPHLINDIVNHRETTYTIPVTGDTIKSFAMKFDPAKFFGTRLPDLKRPKFLPIIASNLLATLFLKKSPEGSVDGFVIEEPTAGGHNAPPRRPDPHALPGAAPVYGEKDIVNYKEIASLGLPFWIGGSHATPEKLKYALSIGAAGIQAGSIFALSEESGMNPELRKKIRKSGFEGKLKVRTDARISPTGFPFKLAEVDGTISEKETYDSRVRVCNKGLLVTPYEKEDGKTGLRCAAEPYEKFIEKGGNPDDLEGRGCLCNGLLATAGVGDEVEPPMITLGDDLEFLPLLMKHSDDTYSAGDAIKYLLCQYQEKPEIRKT